MEKFRNKYDKPKNPPKTDLYTINQVKISLDDFLVEYLTALGFKECNFYVDFSNTIGIFSTIFAGLTCYLSMYYQWEHIKKYITYSVIAYFCINSILFIYCCFKSGKIRFSGLEIATKIQFTDDKNPVYTAMIYKRNKVVPLKYTRTIFDLFYDNGIMDYKILIEDFDKLFKEQ